MLSIPLMYKIRCFLLTIVVASLMSSPLAVADQQQAALAMRKMQPDQYFDVPKVVQLANAVASGDNRLAQLTLDDGVDVNFVGREGMTPLFWAISKQNVDGFRWLLDHGANPNTLTRWQAADGQAKVASALELAAVMKDSSYLQSLLDHGADPNAITNDFEQTPIYAVIMRRGIDNINLLLKYHANPNHQDKFLKTPMLEAVSARMYTIALLLLQSGADPTIKDKWGYNTVDMVKRYGNSAVPRNSPDEAAYDQFVAELRRRDLLVEAPRF
jgi:ankyrin repeat protein